MEYSLTKIMELVYKYTARLNPYSNGILTDGMKTVVLDAQTMS